jgi:divalent metal cation (Fe/Co/Zn/Cd) transporter
LVRQEAPQHSLPGIILATLSILIMPWVARAKRRIGQQISSVAMVADSRQTQLCTWLSVILLGGLGLHAWLGWWWADPLAALVMTPIIAREGWDALQGRSCGCTSCH